MMPRNRIRRAAFPQAASFTLFWGLLLGLSGCEPEADPPVESGGESPVQGGGEVVRLDAAGVERLAREEVPAQVVEGLELSLWAPEPLLIDPHALTVDDRGRVYVFGSPRSAVQRKLNDHYRNRLSETLPHQTVLAHQTVEDLRGFLHRDLAPERSDENEWLPDLNEDGSHDWRDLTVQKERVYRIEDTNGDGRADVSQVIAEDFNTEITDIAGGILVHDGDVFVAVAPDLWRLRDPSGDGIMDVKESISHGYGVRLGFYFGHGMSGVTPGPDGRIYWAVGDVGLNVVDQDGKRWSYPNQGAILRANPDGSDFEVFAAGLRNTYEFVFDEYGNLISVDNDASNPGEKERIVYLVNGSDSGWRRNWQWGKYTDPRNNDYKVWIGEGLHKPRFEGQPAYITPPIAPYINGPAGLVYNPGTALSEAWRDHFFVASAGGPASPIHAFRLEPDGATFELARDTVVVDGILPTGMEFGPDGALYIADLIVKRKSEPSGRILKLDAPEAAGSALRGETEALLAEDFGRRSTTDLEPLLRHADQRVRMEAQFELAERGAAEPLLAAARQTEHLLARLHGIWGIGQLARMGELEQAAPLVALLQAEDPEVRAQAAKVLGDVEYAPAGDALIPLLSASSARVRFFAAQALGQLGHRPAVPRIIAMLEANNGEDAYLRHAGSLALARIGDAEPLVALADHPSRAVRVAAVVALRRMEHPGVARFLTDPDEYIVTEAARAINDDGGIEAALPELARVLEEERFTSEALLRRALNANLRVGTREAAQRVAAYAARTDAPEAPRVEAIAVLGVWPEPSVYDRVDGRYRGAMERDPASAALARAAITPLVEPLLENGSTEIKVTLAEAVGRLDLETAAPALRARLREDRAPEVRIAALRALHAMEAAQLEGAARTALADGAPSVRGAALELVPELGLPEETTAELLASVLERGSIEEQQSALEALGQLQSPPAHQVLGGLLDRLAAGELPVGIQLDLAEAVQASGSQALQAQLAQMQAARPEDPLTTFPMALRGGSAEEGERVVFQNDAAQCIRCHTFGEEGSTVGPNLSEIGSTLNREQLLQALVAPSARIAPGFGTAPSAMPPMGEILSQREIRDVVEYLSTLR